MRAFFDSSLTDWTRSLSWRAIVAIAVCCWAVVVSSPAGALEFSFNPEPGMDQQAIDGFEAAGELWSEIYSDDITVNIDIGFRKLPNGVLGSTGSERIQIDYDDFVAALTADQASTDDGGVIDHLQAGLVVDLLLNRVRNSPMGAGDATPFLDDDGDANNEAIRVTRANAKALDLLPAADGALDASITFSDEFNWDFDPDDGILANHFSFIQVAAHEIGHMLGFTSGVDLLDINSPPVNGPFNDHEFTFVSPIDLFRFSSDSTDEGDGVIDWTADSRDKFFSIDGGGNDLGGFSTGKNFGDGKQASHWKDSLSLGIMDPTVATGEVPPISALDVQLFDVIGFDLVSGTPVVTTDLAISATADVTLTVTVLNNGPVEVSDAAVSDIFPPEFSPVTWSCSGTGGASCTASGTGDVNDLVDLPVGSSVTYVATGTATDFPANVASVSTPDGVTDSDPGNNSS